MEVVELIERLKAYGADIDGINERFLGDMTLYQGCLVDFVGDPNFGALENSIAAKNYDAAFSAAHAIKGLSGNLGVAPCYNAVCTLVESLRAKDYRELGAEFSAVNQQLAALKSLLSDEPLSDARKANKNKNPKRPRVKIDVTIVITILSLLAAVIAVILMFNRLISNYRDNTMQESAAHLTELNQELQLYVETKISSDWSSAHSIANSIVSGQIGADEAVMDYLKREKDISGVSNITLYTESGYTRSTDDSVISNDDASEIVARAQKSGEFLTIRESELIYVVPVETENEYHGERILALSVTQNLSSFLDNMHISSFGGSALLYLTQSNGVVISMLSGDGSDNVYNLLSLLRESSVVPLSDNTGSMEDMLTSDDYAVFLRKTDEGDQYIVSAPIETGYDKMRLFYFVPVAVVNKTTDAFSRYITRMSVVVILSFAVGAVVVFLYAYGIRKRQFSEALAAREHMLDLLVQNSKSAFALLTTSRDEPRFTSGNADKIIGDKYFNLKKTDSGYAMHGSSDKKTDALRELNAQLKYWGGKGEFRSAFIRNASAAIPSYFEIQIFPIDEKKNFTDKDKEQDDSFIAIAQDVTPLYERQSALTEALVMAEQANLAKSSFLSNMSHDIRTPMNAIVNMTNFAKESVGEPEKQMEYLDNLSESSAHLLQLINDVLDMSRIESGRLTISATPFDLRDELNRIADIVRPLCVERGQSFDTDFKRVRTPGVIGDQVKLSQILINLLSNACKFTKNGGKISFTAESVPSLREDIAAVRFTVKDTGIGISKEHLEKIFEPFSRVDDALVNKIEGTGLGLSICRSYVGAMGGTINCESELGKGSEFTVTLSFRKSETESGAIAEAVMPETSFAGRRCLVCEDNYVNQVIAGKLLGSLGFTVDNASDGQEGVDKFLASEPGYYDVIYMDVQMPVMDGYRATQAIRESGHPQAKTIPIIAMTANVFVEDIEKSRAAGMSGHLGKPIQRSDLIETTDKLLNGGGDYH